MAWSASDLKLIKIVEQHPILYNFCLRIRNKKEKKSLEWKLIADELKTSVHQCITRWKALRDAFVRQNSTLPGGGIPENSKKWEDLLFLKKYIHPRKAGRNNPKFVINLIKEVERHPILYNGGYNNLTKIQKTTIWRKIGMVLGGKDPKTCCLKWKNIRYQYRSELLGKGTTSLKWEYFKYLEFMKKQILLEKTNKEKVDSNESHGGSNKDVMHISEDIESNSSNEAYDIDFWGKSNDTELLIDPKSNFSGNPNRKRNLNLTENKSMKQSSFLNQNPYNQNDENNDIESLKIFLQNNMSKLSSEKKNKAMMDIMEYVISIEEEDNVCKTSIL